MAILYLIGTRASGKTTVGQYLSAELNCPFVDLDSWLGSSERKNIDEIVAERGWDEFRRLESHYLAEASDYLRGFPTGVLATGGGIVTLPENVDYLQANGIVIWLRAHPLILERRLRANPENASRPALTNMDPVEEIRHIYEIREPLYRNSARHVVDASLPVKRICVEIIRLCHM